MSLLELSKENDPSLTKRTELFPPTFDIFRKDHDQYGGGVLLGFEKNLGVTELFNIDTNCEILWAKVKVKGNSPIHVGAFYRAPIVAHGQVEEQESIKIV